VAIQQQSVVSIHRFEQGISWKQWMEQIDRNQDKFQDNWDDMQLNANDVAAIKELMEKPNGPHHMLALGEAWCPDVFRGMPVAAKLAEATGLEIKIFFRDQNLDIMNEFLYKGEYQSIPVLVFYTKEHEYLGHWLEKAQKARDEAQILREITSRMREPDLTPETRKQYMDEYAAFQRGPVWDSWKQAQVSEIRSILENSAR
jgi:hypothetical protein